MRTLTDNDAREAQLRQLRRGQVPIRLIRPCTLEDGVRALADDDTQDLLTHYRTAMQAGRITKVVPASGAATRMFRDLSQALNQIEAGQALAQAARAALDELTRRIDEFAFAQGLRDRLGLDAGASLPAALAADPARALRALLGADGLNLAGLPKGLVPFHRYPEGPRSALEEHFHEAIDYVVDAQATARLHFTVSDAARELFESEFTNITQCPRLAGTDFVVSCSVQEPSTDTVCIDADGQMLVDDSGQAITRPAGHGALLLNLGRLDADLVTIKNIDNVVPDRLRGAANRHKALLGGLLVRLQARIFDYLAILEAGAGEPGELLAMLDFAERELLLPAAATVRDVPPAEQRAWLLRSFDRPLRVCGVVPSTGEPGGGPFWTEDPDHPLQIVESISVDQTDAGQRAVWESSTHFNPVDLFCALRDHRGQPYDLEQFKDGDAVMIGEKSHQGRPIRVLERPGLWNGAMAQWNTVFVEVPGASFNPVKTVFNLLRPSHRA